MRKQEVVSLAENSCPKSVNNEKNIWTPRTCRSVTYTIRETSPTYNGDKSSGPHGYWIGHCGPGLVSFGGISVCLQQDTCW